MLTVLKLGGSVLDSPQADPVTWDSAAEEMEPPASPRLAAEPASARGVAALAAAVARRVAAGEQLCLVHGGGAALTGFLTQQQIPSRFHQGLRITDAATLEAALMVLAGTVNKRLVAALNQALAAAGRSTRAVGLCGLDGNCVPASPADPALGYVGQVTVDATTNTGKNASAGREPGLLQVLLAAGFLPVLASIAAGPAGPLNVNADSFAAACAAQLGAARLSFVTDVPGVLDAGGTVVAALGMDQLDAWSAAGRVRGGMLPKLAACRHALERGVAQVEVIGAAALLSAPPPGAPSSGTQITLGNPA